MILAESPSRRLALRHSDNEVELQPVTPTAGATPRASFSNLTSVFWRHEAQRQDDQKLPPSSPGPYYSLDNDPFNSNTLDDDSFDASADEPEDAKRNLNNMECGGQPIEWTMGSVWDSYAYQLHNDDSLSWKLIGFKEDKFIVIQSQDSCTGELVLENERLRGTCNSCFELRNSLELRKFIRRASEEVKPNTPWMYLNHRQLEELLIKSKKKEQDLSLKVPQHHYLNSQATT